MNRLEGILRPLAELPAYRQLKEIVDTAGARGLFGLDDSQRMHFLAGLAEETGRPLVLIVPSEQAAARCAQDLSGLLSGAVMTLPPREVSFLRTAASSRDLNMRRLHVLGLALTGELRALIVPADSMLYRLMPRHSFLQGIITLKEGERRSLEGLMAQLVAAGYERVETTEARGQCALRGGILDVYPVGSENALRVEFFDDEIDSLRDFDVMTQRSFARRQSARIFPAQEVILSGDEAVFAGQKLMGLVVNAARGPGVPGQRSREERQRALEKEFDLMPCEQFFELIGEEEQEPERAAVDGRSLQYALHTGIGRNYASRIDALSDGHAFPGAESLIHLLYDETCTLFEYFHNPIVVLDQPDRLRERCENRILEYEEHFKVALERGDALQEQATLLLPYDRILAQLSNYSVIALSTLVRTMKDLRFDKILKVEGLNASGYQRSPRELMRDLDRWVSEGWRVALLAGGMARGERLKRMLEELGMALPFQDPAPETLVPGRPVILAASLNRGFLYPEIKLALITESDIFGTSRHKTSSRSMPGEKIAAFTDLKAGDYVVHESHGIGRYMGTVRLASEGTFRDFLHIQYLGSDKLYVPTDQMDRVQKYIGSEGEAPKLNRLSGGEWQRQKSKVQKAIQEIAGELVRLYAARLAAKGHAFSPDTPWQRQLEDSFEYEETPDQVQALAEIKQDMESPRCMDRLLCGDVGYGKTEVAIRAIFKAVMDGKQAALLAPTTILVQQHYATLLQRFDGFPVRVETLSRFRTPGEQKKTIQDLKSGEVDVVIGTHRLLGKDVGYKDLGLLVVDEEQRFGVKHKETIKKFKNSIDVLTLSATPIPRTLHMSMVGIRDMSLLRTPPEERYPVQTYVVEYSDGLVRDAILREISRGGQVYVLYNRVRTIDVMYQRLSKLVPEARIAVGHGQMREHALEDVMLDFYEGKFNVLLCSTIIEAGLDVPRANTLIVCDADRFGLAQLYQLRGRVGRSNRLAYAYLTVSPNRVLTESADKRLTAIREFTQFGSGFRVAMRDLEIRGTGNLLGVEQSGHMASVGYDLYVKMIEETVARLRGNVSLGDIQTRVEVKVDAYLPAEYVPSDLARVEMYKKIACITTRAQRDDMIEELIDRFGDPTRPVLNLLNIAQLKSLCNSIGIELVIGRPGEMVMHFAPTAEPDVAGLLEALAPYDRYVRMQGGKRSALIFTMPGRSTEEMLTEALHMMEDVAPKAVSPTQT